MAIYSRFGRGPLTFFGADREDDGTIWVRAGDSPDCLPKDVREYNVVDLKADNGWPEISAEIERVMPGLFDVDLGAPNTDTD